MKFKLLKIIIISALPLFIAAAVFALLSFKQKAHPQTKLSEDFTTYRNSFGLELPIDTTVQKAYGAYQYKNTENTYQSYYKNSPTTPNAIRFANRLGSISFYTPSDQSFGTLQAGRPNSQHNTLTYADVYPEIDLKYTVYPTKLLEEFIVKDQATALKVGSLRQIAKVTGVSSYEEKNGSIIFKKKDQTGFIIPPPVMYQVGNETNRSLGIRYDIQEISKNNYVISKVITDEGRAWLADPERSYPIIIDLVIDNADTASSWVSSDTSKLVVSQEATIKQEGSGSLKLLSKSILGTGADGNCIIDNGTKVLDSTAGSSVCNSSTRATAYAVNFSSTVNTTAGATTITLSSATTGLAAGDEVLIINLQGVSADYANAGKYETKYIQAIDTGTNTLTLDSALANTYNGTTQKIMVQRIPNFGNVTVCGGNTGSGCTAAATLTTTAWNGTKNGVLFFRSTGSVVVNSGGTITTTGLGFAGGPGESAMGGDYRSYKGASYCNPSTNGGAYNSGPANCGGGGGGFSWWNYYPAGAGGGNFSSGASNGGNTAATGGSAGAAYGATTLESLFLGSGGGAGGRSANAGGGAGCSGSAGTGGAGGGIIGINADTITINGSLASNGATGGSYSGGSPCRWGGSGGGSGGAILIRGNTVTLNSTSTTGGGAGANYGGSSGAGGGGGAGRTAVYSSSLTGDSNPAAYTSSTNPSPVNSTATLTTSGTDLSTSNFITFLVRSNRTGGFLTLQFGETDSSEQSQSFTINSADTWEEKTWDISGIPAASRNAVTKFAFKITADIGSFTYIDDLQASNTPLPNIGAATALSSSSIRWNFTDNATDETGYKVYDSSGSLMSTCAGSNLSYCDETGLSPNTQYTRKVASYNQSGDSGRSATTSKYTLAAVPSPPAVSNRAATTVAINPDPATNPAATTFAIYREEGSTCDGSGGVYLAADGSSNGDTAVWQTDSAWGTVTATGLSAEKSYVFCVKGKNGDGVETDFGSIGAYNAGYVPLSGDYIYTTDTANSNSFTNRYVDGNNGARYVLGVDDGGTPNRAKFVVKSGILTVNATDTLAVGTLELTGGSVAIANGGKIEVGKAIWTVDQDNDGYSANNKAYVGDAPTNGKRKSAILTLSSQVDCDDTNAAVGPGSPSTFYRDADSDTYGNPLNSTQACTVPAGYVADNTDCGDGSANAKPGSSTCSSSSFTNNSGVASYDWNCSASGGAGTQCGTVYGSYATGTFSRYNGNYHECRDESINYVYGTAACGAPGYVNSYSIDDSCNNSPYYAAAAAGANQTCN